MRPAARPPDAHAARPAWDTVLRLLAAGLGGYALAQVLPVALVAPWGLARADAVLVAMLLGLVVHALAFMAAFAARTGRRACVLMALWVSVSTAVAWVAL